METAADVTGMDAGSMVELGRRHGLEGGALAGGGAWDMMRHRILGWSDYQDGWDGDDSVAPLASTLRHAMDFAYRAKARGIALPKLGLYGDGEVEFRWTNGRASASVALLSDGAIVAYVRPSTREPAYQVDEPFEGTD